MSTRSVLLVYIRLFDNLAITDLQAPMIHYHLRTSLKTTRTELRGIWDGLNG